MAKTAFKSLLVLLAMGAVQAFAAMPPDVFPMKDRNFEIPITIAEGQRDRIRELQLYVSSDEGKTWNQHSVVPPDKSAFTYFAPTDGMFWFKVRTVDKQGNQEPSDIYKSDAVRKILVDTLPPSLRLVKTERQGDEILVNWEMQEDNPDLTTLKLEYRTPDSVSWMWYTAPVSPEKTGQARFQFVNAGPVTIRMSVSDAAGNQASTTAEIPAKSTTTVTSTSNSATVATGAASNGGGSAPAPVMPPPSNNWQTAAPTQPAPVNTSATLPTTTTQPVAQYPVAGPAPVQMPPTYQPTAGYVVPTQRPAYTPPTPGVINGNLPPAPQTGHGQVAIPGHTVAGSWSDPSQHGINDNVARPSDRNWNGVGIVQSNYNQQARGTASQPGTRWANGVQTRITNSTQVDLDYEVKKVGPSGVGKVDLYVTYDEGAHWQWYAEDPDLTSPIAVTFPGEGVFGVRLVVTSRAGIGRRPPVAGDLPDMRIEIDTTAPVVKLFRPEPDGRRRDAVVLAWTATDNNMKPNPITLLWSDRPDGNWKTIATNLANSGRYTWNLTQDLPDRVYLQVVACDWAGNLGHDDSPGPVTIDLTEPEGQILDIKRHP